MTNLHKKFYIGEPNDYGKNKPVVNNWYRTQKSFEAWKKTEDFRQWRHKQFLYQGGTCFYCHQPLQGTRINIDHIYPKSYSYSNDKKNLVLACWECNKNKDYKKLSAEKIRELRKINKSKKGTYLKLKETYKTDVEFGRELGEMFKNG